MKFHSPAKAIDTAKPTGRPMWQMIRVLAELDRSVISERTRARELIDDGQRLLNVNRTTLYRARLQFSADGHE
jgi:hypothetical protein